MWFLLIWSCKIRKISKSQIEPAYVGVRFLIVYLITVKFSEKVLIKIQCKNYSDAWIAHFPNKKS